MRASIGRRLAGLFAVACTLVTTAAAGPARGAESAAAPASIAVPAGVTAGVAVFDRQAAAFTEQLNVDLRFRSASIVKLLIALDYLWLRGPDYAVPAADRTRLDAMLRGSDDDAASYYWARNGYEQVINRMVPRLGLRDTAPPPAAQRGYWGYTAITAGDVVRVYRYLLDSAPPAVRQLIMDDLRQSTRCAADSYDQNFGIPSVFARPRAVKQGWSGFGDAPMTCTGGSAPAARAAAAGVDLVREALHTTGTVGPDDRDIVVVLTLHPDGTPFAKAYNALTGITRSLNVPGGARLPGTAFGTWGSGVRVRSAPNTGAAPLGVVPAGTDVLVSCQKLGEEVVVSPYRNPWWAYLPQFGGYLTNIYVSSPDNRLPNVPDC
ncbi:SH3 domain-containing protein [Actinoplanes sp. NPDC049668]|uniref:SH3 domain-containing protein n=1 Tax=unclassified Actinoplanes TaxID=2626549 RepID=UPI0033BDAE04